MKESSSWGPPYSHNEHNREVTFFQHRLIRWFAENRRNFPWREEKDPYKILIAEIMLQRTKAEQVFPVYEEFIRRFPDVKSLVLSNIEDIAKFMERLGLFWRSKLIKEMAKMIMTEYGGVVPEERSLLLRIPGVGDYIADAILVFAFESRRTVVDSNVVRLASRFFGVEIKGEMRRNRKFVEFCQILSSGLNGQEIRHLNWAMIDHSSAICRPAPLCSICPMSEKCNYLNRLINNRS